MNAFWRYTLTGIVAGVVLGGLLSLVSGNYLVVVFVGLMGTVVGIVLGVVHRYDR
jgi:hypothetical protein